MSTLDTYLVGSRPVPQPIAISREIRDRGSLFIATLYRATSPEEAKSRVNHLKHVVHASKPASHEIAAWRCMVPKAGKTGLEGPDDFHLVTGSQDDGENWAGAKVLNTMQAQSTIDAVVIVSRWWAH